MIVLCVKPKTLFIMKKVLLIVLMSCIAEFVFAQANTLQVTNNTSCPVYYQVHTSFTSSPCSNSGSGPIYSLAASGTITYNAASLPWSPSGGPFYIVGVKVFDGSTACASQAFPMGESCTGWPQSASYKGLTATCNFCANIIATYTPATTVGGAAALDFN
jgi:hypothetical protein